MQKVSKLQAGELELLPLLETPLPQSSETSELISLLPVKWQSFWCTGFPAILNQYTAALGCNWKTDQN